MQGRDEKYQIIASNPTKNSLKRKWNGVWKTNLISVVAKVTVNDYDGEILRVNG